MAVNPKTTVRKNVSLSLELANAVARFQDEQHLTSESEAIRTLIEIGIMSKESSEDLVERCRDCVKNGKTANWIFTNILQHHPKMINAAYNSEIIDVCLMGYDMEFGVKTGKFSVTRNNFVPREEHDH